MIDKTSIKISDIAGGQFRRAGNELHGPCPMCGGKDRFVIKPSGDGDIWLCRQCDGNGGKWSDVIDLVKILQNTDFTGACEYLGINRPKFDKKPYKPRFNAIKTPFKPRRHDYVALKDWDWMITSWEFIDRCRDVMDSSEGQRARDYLHNRGIDDIAIDKNYVGFNPTPIKERWGGTDVYIPRGIVFPNEINGKTYRIKVRTNGVNQPKYSQPSGCVPSLYGLDFLRRESTVILVESEIEVLILQSQLRGYLSSGLTPIATGSTSHCRGLEWFAKLNRASHVFVAFDTDSAGENASQYWLEKLGSKASRLKPKTDVGDMVHDGSDFESWLQGAGNKLPVGNSLKLALIGF